MTVTERMVGKMQIYEKMVELLDVYVRADEIHPEDTFKSDLDLSSFELIGFATDVKEAFGVSLKVEDFYNNPSVAEMAKFIEENSTK